MAKLNNEWCCLHSECPIIDCPETVCIIDAYGSIEAYLRDKRIKEALKNCSDIEEFATTLNISESQAQKLFKMRAK
jgi:hypothetical protein